MGEVEIELPDKPIKAISVTVLSGDETGTVIFDDGTTVDFDASYWRVCDFFDGSYTVIGEQVSDWLAFRPSDGRTHRCLSAAGTFFLMTRVTNHAARRTKERLGLPKKLSHKNAENALRYGIRHSDTSGSLHRYIRRWLVTVAGKRNSPCCIGLTRHGRTSRHQRSVRTSMPACPSTAGQLLRSAWLPRWMPEDFGWITGAGSGRMRSWRLCPRV